MESLYEGRIGKLSLIGTMSFIEGSNPSTVDYPRSKRPCGGYFYTTSGLLTSSKSLNRAKHSSNTLKYESVR